MATDLEEWRASQIWKIKDEGVGYAMMNWGDELAKLDPEFAEVRRAYEAAHAAVLAYVAKHEAT